MIKLIENQMLNFEKLLKASRTSKELNNQGQFFTPFALSHEIVKESIKYLPEIYHNEIRFLEPAFGHGSFYLSLISELNKCEKYRLKHALGIEKDEKIFKFSSRIFDEHDLNLINQDFTTFKSMMPRANLLITNPPYVRHHHLSLKDKSKLKEAVSDVIDIKVSGLAGLHIYFMLLAHAHLEKDSISSWLIPSEFMSVGYGSALRQYLTEYVTLERIHIYNIKKSLFDNAAVSSAVVIYRNSKPKETHEVKISVGDSIDTTEFKKIKLSEFKRTDKWINLFHETDFEFSNKTARLSDFFEIKRGIATGANNIFIISEEQKNELGLPPSAYKFIVPSKRELDKVLKDDIIRAENDGSPSNIPKRYLIDCDLKMEDMKYELPRLYRYFNDIENRGLNKSYLLSKRSPWYKQEKRHSPLFLCSYMGRAKAGSENATFKIYMNKSKAIAPNTYLMIYPKEFLKVAIQDNPGLEFEIFNILRKISNEAFSREGREYGGGLQKVEPSELANLPVEGIKKLLDALSVEGETYQPSFFKE